MSSRSKEKMTAAFRKLFRSSDKIDRHHQEKTTGSGSTSGENNSPRRLLNRIHRDSVRVGPSESNPAALLHMSPRNAHKSKKLVDKPALVPVSSKTATYVTETGAKHGKIVRARRLMKELQEIQKSQKESTMFSVDLINDSLFEWSVKLYKIDPESDLHKDMKELNISQIQLNLTFPENFPFAPPFMRVISPRIEKGFVMEGGAICMELLTPRGWASAYTVEAVIMQFAASLVKGQGRIARKAKTTKEFTRRSAEESFRSLVKTHEKYGWVTPPLQDG